MTPNLTRRAATEADIPYLYDLRIASMAPHIVAAGLVVTPDEHMTRVRDKLASAEIILSEAKPAGMIKTAKEPGFWHIMQLQVEPALHGTGVGAEILRQVIAEACAAGAQLTLGVLKVNPARRLYERMGFVKYGESLHEFEMVWRGTEAELLAQLRAREIALHIACVMGDIACVKALVHEDFHETGRSGKAWSKASLLRALESETTPGPSLHSQDYALHTRTAESALLIYRSADINANGALERHTLRSSLWTYADGKWQMRFHQGTACEAFDRRP